MLDWFVRIMFWIFCIATGDLTYLVIGLLWEIWDELIKIRKELRK